MRYLLSGTRPDANWLNFVVIAKARTQIRCKIAALQTKNIQCQLDKIKLGTFEYLLVEEIDFRNSMSVVIKKKYT
ncbi:hypothetical protein [Candidatus Hoaglandella endobia]|uniref:hypothetical protein n=1 Tax=Candidatus Hoaglandella endobia TaxID=1778263 RepID=UPI0008706BED|nr:hypothetical protein [Candidatus Hoaglandella endobia]